MSQEASIGAGLDVVWFESCAVPFNVGVVVCEVEGIGSPVDLRVDVGEPRFSKNEVVFFQWVEDGVEGVRVAFAFNGDGDGVVGDGGTAVGEKNGNGGNGCSL